MVVYYLFRPSKKKSFLNKVCECKLINVPSNYVLALGIVGVFLSMLDIIRVLKGGPTLPCALWRSRIKAGLIVSPECERDLKLISLILSVEYYALLVSGILLKNPTYLLPWLCFYAFILLVEFFIFISKMYSEGWERNKQPLITTIYLIYNWLVVYCIYESYLPPVDQKC